MSGYSVLMPIYAREVPQNLNRALGSISNQTWPPSEIVLVKDGALTVDLDKVIEEHRVKSRPKIVVIQLEKNMGLGTALQVGLEACTFPVVARMDADDIAAPTRCEKQLKFLELHPEIDAVGSWISEFDRDETDIYAYRTLPTDPDELVALAKLKCPLNHMSVIYRKMKVIAAGGYQPGGLEDYFLWIRMLLNGSRFANIPEVLVNVRAGRSQISRRGGLPYAFRELRLQREMLKLGFIDMSEFARNVCIRFVTRLVPVFLRRQIYRVIRRQQSNV